MALPASPLYRPVTTVLLMLGGLLAAGGTFHLAAKWYLIPARMDALLQDAPESEVGQRMDQILASSAQPPQQQLLKWMGSERGDIALEAVGRLKLQLSQWEQHPGIAIAPQARQLAEELQKKVSDYPEPIRREVRDIAIRMASWKLGPNSADDGPMLLALESILRETISQPLSDSPVAASEAALDQFLGEENSRLTTPVITSSVDVSLHDGLPMQQATITDPPVEAQAIPSFTTTTNARPTGVLTANHRSSISQPLKLPPLVASPKQIEPGAHRPEPLPDLSRLTTLEIMWKLHAQDQELAEHVRETLKARSFSPEDLQLATRMTHPQVSERLQLVRELPSMGRNDMTNWLYYMTKDPDDGVRYGAASALLTSSDPRLLKRLKADLATDPSPRVQTLIKR
ncbi:HEAT repeat domain-containing protein [Bremerella sp. JC817]|uniref:HEAT repeat domain-containing protein n=1 Tax=Bremerella sp. JC817 TaxID=3231756 RepID=UPI0034593DA9